MIDLSKQIEAILLYKNEPLSIKELSKILNKDKAEILSALKELEENYKDRGIVIINSGDEIGFGTSPIYSELIENIQKEELSRDLGRAGLETLAIVLYKAPVSRREIDYIRGVNSGFILRNLLIRGLIERTESEVGERSFSYKPTLVLLEHLGITKKEELPEFESAFKKLQEFAKTENLDQSDERGED